MGPQDKFIFTLFIPVVRKTNIKNMNTKINIKTNIKTNINE